MRPEAINLGRLVMHFRNIKNGITAREVEVRAPTGFNFGLAIIKGKSRDCSNNHRFVRFNRI